MCLVFRLFLQLVCINIVRCNRGMLAAKSSCSALASRESAAFVKHPQSLDRECNVLFSSNFPFSGSLFILIILVWQYLQLMHSIKMMWNEIRITSCLSWKRYTSRIQIFSPGLCRHNERVGTARLPRLRVSLSLPPMGECFLSEHANFVLIGMKHSHARAHTRTPKQPFVLCIVRLPAVKRPDIAQ